MTTAHALPDHARESVHGGRLDADTLLSVLPGAEPPGFDLLSPRAAHVLLALFDHLRRFGYVVERTHRDFSVKEPQATWTVQGVAFALGNHCNQAGKTLAELTDFGYLMREDLRRIGQIQKRIPATKNQGITTLVTNYMRTEKEKEYCHAQLV